MNITVLYIILIITTMIAIIKSFEYFGLSKVQALIANYFTAGIFTFSTQASENLQHLDMIPGILKGAAPMGLVFFSVFYLTSLVAEKHGLAIMSVLNKMSVIITIIISTLLYNEIITVTGYVGIALALIAILLTNYKDSESKSPMTLASFFLLLVFFIGSGMVDTSIKFMQARLITRTPFDNETLYISCVFAMAGIWGMFYLLKELAQGTDKPSPKSIGAGIILGTVNYFSLFFSYESSKSARSTKLSNICNS
ncbi:MAG: hypothetical protein IPO27_08155 [Bacteroidetes bacterium]|nr:hypothetical protein [Bacteroidota bacterium]